MASISTNSKGGTRLIFELPDGEHAIWLGTLGKGLTKRDITTWRTHVEELASAIMQGRAPYNEAVDWSKKLPDQLFKKLLGKRREDGSYTHGLVPPRETPEEAAPVTIADYCERYLASRTDLAPGSVKVYRRAVKALNAFFPGKALVDVRLGDADKFRLWLSKPEFHKGIGDRENTVRKDCDNAKRIFGQAVRDGLIPANPFGDMKKLALSANPERTHYIPAELVERVIDAAPNPRWKAIFALAYYGGLRCPSEVVVLKWTDIDWKNNTFKVYSPKLRRNPKKRYRTVPLFPELRAHLEAAFKVRRGSELVVPPMIGEANFSNRFPAICKKAGVKPWKRPFQNLRSSRETALVDAGFPIHVVTAWLGNSPQIAQKHYLQVTAEHMAEALLPIVKKSTGRSTGTVAVTRGNEGSGDSADSENPREIADTAEMVTIHGDGNDLDDGVSDGDSAIHVVPPSPVP